MEQTRLQPCPEYNPGAPYRKELLCSACPYGSLISCRRHIPDSRRGALHPDRVRSHHLVKHRVWTNAFLTCSRVCHALMRQTVSDCRSRCSRWLLVINSCALQSPIVCLNTYRSVETQNWKSFHYTVARSSLDSSFWDPCGSCSGSTSIWPCASRDVLLNQHGYIVVLKTRADGRCSRPILTVWIVLN